MGSNLVCIFLIVGLYLTILVLYILYILVTIDSHLILIQITATPFHQAGPHYLFFVFTLLSCSSFNYQSCILWPISTDSCFTHPWLQQVRDWNIQSSHNPWLHLWLRYSWQEVPVSGALKHAVDIYFSSSEFNIIFLYYWLFVLLVVKTPKSSV